MAGLVPAIHVLCSLKEGVDARDKPGHDEPSRGFRTTTTMVHRFTRQANLLNFALLSHLRDASGARNRVRVKTVFASRFKLIWVVQIRARK